MLKFIAATVIVGLFGGEAVANDVRCGPREVVLAALAEQYDEQIVVAAFDESRNRLIELLVSQAGTWTLLETSKSDQTCVLRFGTAIDLGALMIGDIA